MTKGVMAQRPSSGVSVRSNILQSEIMPKRIAKLVKVAFGLTPWAAEDGLALSNSRESPIADIPLVGRCGGDGRIAGGFCFGRVLFLLRTIV